VLASYGKFKSEKVNAYELGYRFNPIDRVSISIATFYNQYFDVRSIDTNVTPPPLFYFANSTEAKTFGAEVSANFIATDWWRLRGGYSYLHEDFNYTSPYTYPKSRLFEAIDPQHQILIQSIIDIPHGFQFDADARFISELPAFLDGTKVPSYTSLNVRLGWIYKWLTVSVQAQNLLEENHIEFGTRKIPRRFMGKLSINLN
jgi:iron complex outermembrane receptor protein